MKRLAGHGLKVCMTLRSGKVLHNRKNASQRNNPWLRSWYTGKKNHRRADRQNGQHMLGTTVLLTDGAAFTQIVQVTK